MYLNNIIYISIIYLLLIKMCSEDVFCLLAICNFSIFRSRLKNEVNTSYVLILWTDRPILIVSFPSVRFLEYSSTSINNIKLWCMFIIYNNVTLKTLGWCFLHYSEIISSDFSETYTSIPTSFIFIVNTLKIILFYLTQYHEHRDVY